MLWRTTDSKNKTQAELWFAFLKRKGKPPSPQNKKRKTTQELVCNVLKTVIKTTRHHRKWWRVYCSNFTNKHWNAQKKSTKTVHKGSRKPSNPSIKPQTNPQTPCMCYKISKLLRLWQTSLDKVIGALVIQPNMRTNKEFPTQSPTQASHNYHGRACMSWPPSVWDIVLTSFPSATWLLFSGQRTELVTIFSGYEPSKGPTVEYKAIPVRTWTSKNPSVSRHSQRTKRWMGLKGCEWGTVWPEIVTVYILRTISNLTEQKWIPFQNFEM